MTGPQEPQDFSGTFDEIVGDPHEPTGNGAAPRSEPPLPLHAYVPRPFAQIPRRQWLLGGHYIRGHVVMTVAPGGWGKTTLILANAIEMVTGSGLLGPAAAKPLRALYWNGEDPDDEIERRLAAICIRYNITPESLAADDRLFFGSKISVDQRLASADRAGNILINEPVLRQVIEFIGDNKIDCAMFDPLVAFHSLKENDNTNMDRLIKNVFEHIAERHQCCIELSQHTRKANADITAEDSRGAGAVVFAARSVRVLNRMTFEEAEQGRVAAHDRRLYLKVIRDKVNMVPPEQAKWIRLASVPIPNGDKGEPGDWVQAAEPWDYPQPLEGIGVADMNWMRDTMRAGTYRKDPRSPEWAGWVLIDHLGLNRAADTDQAKAKKIIKAWFANGALKTAKRKGPDRHEVDFVVPGDWDGQAKPNEQAKPMKPPVEESTLFRQFKLDVIGDAPGEAVCMHCREGGDVKRIRNAAEVGGKSEVLHEGCAATWFKP